MATRKTPKDPNAPKKWPTSDYETGYARPPKNGQIKPGEVRNRWGPKGKPKPVEIDPFEHAAAQLTTVTLNGEQLTMTAEAAAHIVAMQKAIAGDPRAMKNMQDERRARRRAGSPAATEEEVRQKREHEDIQRKSKIIISKMLAFFENGKREGTLVAVEGEWKLAPWLEAAMADYRQKCGASRDPGHGPWDPYLDRPVGPNHCEG